MNLRTCGGSQITKKIRSAKRKTARCRICWRSADPTNYLTPQICGFAIFGSYLRTAQPLDLGR
jgi:hypothetical protein